MVITNRTCQPTRLIEISCRRTSTLIHLSDHRIRQLTELARCIVLFEVWVSSSSSILVSWLPLRSVGGEEMEIRMACPRKAVPLRAELKDHKRGLHDSVK